MIEHIPPPSYLYIIGHAALYVAGIVAVFVALVALFWIKGDSLKE